MKPSATKVSTGLLSYTAYPKVTVPGSSVSWKKDVVSMIMVSKVFAGMLNSATWLSVAKVPWKRAVEKTGTTFRLNSRIALNSFFFAKVRRVLDICRL